MITFIKRLSSNSQSIYKQSYKFCTSNDTNILGEYVIKSKMSGSSQENLYGKYRNFYNSSIDKVNIPGTTIVRSKDQAHKAVKILKDLKNRSQIKDKLKYFQYYSREHAWDTETVDVDAKLESPIGKGKIICASAFCGLDVDFGNGPRLFIDNFAQNTDLILIFKEYLEDSKYKKIWHNYGFDRHIMNNHGINVSGFGGDTMHMSRLADPSRGPKEYSLSSITKYYEDEIKNKKYDLLHGLRKIVKENTLSFKQILNNLQQDLPLDQRMADKYKLDRFDSKEQKISFLNKQIELLESKLKPAEMYEQYYLNANIKTNMKTLFGRKKFLKDGKEGKTIEFPNIIRMHTDVELVEKWVHYSCLDAEVTFFAFQILKDELRSLSTNFEDMKNMYDLYNKYWKPFGEILTDLEKRGFELNLQHLEVFKLTLDI